MKEKVITDAIFLTQVRKGKPVVYLLIEESEEESDKSVIRNYTTTDVQEILLVGGRKVVFKTVNTQYTFENYR